MSAREQVFSTPAKGVLDPYASGSTVPKPKVNAVARLRIWAFEAHHRSFQCNSIYLVGSAEQRQWNSEASARTGPRPNYMRSLRCNPRHTQRRSGLAERAQAVANRLDDTLPRNPTTGIAGCCARTASGHAATPSSSVMNARCFIIRSPRRRGRATPPKRQAKSCGRSEGSSRIALCRIELYIWFKHARAWDKVCFQTDAVGVLEQHRIVTRCPCPLLRAVDYDGPYLSK